MSELATYSIETDQTVLLAFKDGRKLRVSTAQLTQYLAKPDLEKVRSAMRLRQDFLRRHMPKVALVVAVTGLIGLLTVGGRAVAQLISPPQAAPPASGNTEVVRNQLNPEPSVASPAPSPAVKGASVAAASTPSPNPKANRRKVVPKSNPPHAQLSGLKITVPVPSVLPNPVVDTTLPSPTPLPTPQVPNQNGDVLGDSVTPTPTPTPSPTPEPGPLANATDGLPSIP